MPPLKPVTVSVDVPTPRPEVFAFLDVMANHETFTDHVLKDWTYEGPPSGVGSRAIVTVKAGGPAERVEIEVVEAEAPRLIRERNVGKAGKRVGHGTYELTERPDGGTRISFTYAWETAPRSERLMSPLVRALIRRANGRAMERLGATLRARSA